MLRLVDNFLNRVTMYRLVLYYVWLLVATAGVLSAFGLLPFTPAMLLTSLLVITAVCWITQQFFARAFDAPVNTESLYITALILVLIISPPHSFTDWKFLELAVWASVWAMAGKFVIAIRRKHIFNPAALAVAITALTLNQSASWWVGTMVMTPFVLIGGLLLTRKLRRFDLILSFFLAAVVTIIAPHLNGTILWSETASRIFLSSPILFFAFAMLTEPLTAPPKRSQRILYGALTGFFFAPWVHIGSFFFTPELSLLLGNIFVFIVSPKEKLLLTLTEKIRTADDEYDFRFSSDRPMRFLPGQFMEWTLAHEHPDNRGNRRYLTIASAPEEKGISIGVKFYPRPSTFKQRLLALKKGDTIVAAQRAGEFVMPKDPKRKLCFVAGGIGITPFRSMIGSLMIRQEKRPIVLLYSNRTKEDIAYRELFDEAARQIGLKTVYTLTDKTCVPADWTECVGRLDAATIKREVPDYAERLFYLSGTHAMVTAFERTLREMGVKGSQIHKDFFPGFA